MAVLLVAPVKRGRCRFTTNIIRYRSAFYSYITYDMRNLFPLVSLVRDTGRSVWSSAVLPDSPLGFAFLGSHLCGQPGLGPTGQRHIVGLIIDLGGRDEADLLKGGLGSATGAESRLTLRHMKDGVPPA